MFSLRLSFLIITLVCTITLPSYSGAPMRRNILHRAFEDKHSTRSNPDFVNEKKTKGLGKRRTTQNSMEYRSTQHKNKRSRGSKNSLKNKL